MRRAEMNNKKNMASLEWNFIENFDKDIFILS